MTTKVKIKTGIPNGSMFHAAATISLLAVVGAGAVRSPPGQSSSKKALAERPR
jgi:hypothetical protein